MSMISEQVIKLRDCVRRFRNFETVTTEEMLSLIGQAADTIETMSAKLASANMARSEWYRKIKWILMLLRAGQKEAHEKADGLEKGDNMKSFFTGKEAGICKAIDLIENDEQWKNEKRYYGGGWIPCSERLPEKDCNALVQLSEKFKNIVFENGFVLACYDKSNGWILNSHIDVENTDVIAWQFLPEPYKPDWEARHGVD